MEINARISILNKEDGFQWRFTQLPVHTMTTRHCSPSHQQPGREMREMRSGLNPRHSGTPFVCGHNLTLEPHQDSYGGDSL